MYIKEIIEAINFIKAFRLDIEKSEKTLKIICENIESLKNINIYTKNIYYENNLIYIDYVVSINKNESIFTVCNNKIINKTLFGYEDEIKLAEELIKEYLKQNKRRR